MTRLTVFILLLMLSLPHVHAQATDEPAATRFATVDIVLDPHDTPLAAYQLTFQATSGDVRIVGIEGGEHPAFSEPPHYDPKAIQRQRVILAAFSTADADDLPAGKTRVATIHLQITGDTQPQYALDLTVAADAQGEPIEHADARTQEPNP